MPIQGIPVSRQICQTLFGISAPYGKHARSDWAASAVSALDRLCAAGLRAKKRSMKTAACDARHTLSATDYDIVSLARIRSLVTLPALLQGFKLNWPRIASLTKR